MGYDLNMITIAAENAMRSELPSSNHREPATTSVGGATMLHPGGFAQMSAMGMYGGQLLLQGGDFQRGW